MTVDSIRQRPIGQVLPEVPVAKAKPRDEVVAKVNECCLRASRVKPAAEKREIYLEAFQALKSSTDHELRPTLFQLFERYAMDGWYANVSQERDASGQSVDPELGFRKSARLLELSFWMQLHDFGLHRDEAGPVAGYSSLEELIDQLGIKPTDRGVLIDRIMQTAIDPSVLASEADKKGLRAVMAKTLVGLTYSLQNLKMFSQPKVATYQLHRKLQDWTEALIGRETQELQRSLADYYYNRCVFMCRLRGGSAKEKIDSYIPVLAELKACYSPQDQKLIEMEGRIWNMRGLIMHDSGLPDAAKQAETYFERAYATYYLMAKHDKFLIGNVLTSLIHCFSTKPLDDTRYRQLREYMQELERIVVEFKREGSEHCYVEEYPESIAEAEKALAAFKGGR